MGRVTDIEWSELAPRVRDRTLALVDTRTSAEFARGAIPGATNLNTDQLRFAVGYDISRPFRIDTQVNWDVTQGQVLENRSLLTYRGSCYTVYLEYRQLRVPGNNRNDVRLVLNLKDIGTLLDVNGAMSAGLF